MNTSTKARKFSAGIVGLSLFGVSSIGAAQSSVTLYGIIDAAVQYNSNGGAGKVFSMGAGPLKGNRFGFLGSEDLGAGYKAVFRLESGFSTTTGALGQGGAEFGRQAYVGIASPYGTVTLGRQYDSVVDYVGVLKSGGDTAGAYSGHPADLDNTANNYRVNNAVKYTSPNYKGITFGGLFSLGGFAGDFRRNRVYSAGAGYKSGPVQLGLAYLNAQDPNFSFYGNNPSSSTTNSNMAGSPVFSGYASAKTLQVIAAAGAYTIDNWTLGLVYTNTQYQSLGFEPTLADPGYRGKAVFNTIEINLKSFVTPSLLFGTSYHYTHGSEVTATTGGAGYHQVSAGVDYFLSKRTDIYAVQLWQHATGRDSTGNPAVATIFGVSPSSSNNQFLSVVGIRHAF
ncbi:MAG TPA: porin [Paraburkholderia sp.]|uniref:porin n=1 Tax=Paraburkholderia sp. TaxID=1926495 RepID=UPI002ED63142